MIPKFRVFIKETITETDKMKDVILISFKSKLVRTNDEKWYGFEDAVLMQSTGLKDKNGVEIYEGDIVRVTDDDESTDFSDGGIGTINGLDDLFMWYIDGDVENGLFDINWYCYIEVIGNIWEDGELLEGATR